ARAAAAFEQAHDINREESGSLVRWGEVELARGNRESAGRILRVAHEMNPRSTSALLLSAYLARENGRGARSGELLERAAASLEKMEQVEGVAGEGDTRSDKLSESGRRAERRRLFSACVRQLARAPRPLDGEVLFACVEEEIREMSAAR
ncbi:MAG: hypothetical protein QGH59_03545, partial [Gemmatimonadota bacterium]|nr:hypothetical protein [Gemmatimonadota bacterium]